MASASLARGLSSDVNSKVSSGLMSFRRKPSSVTRKGLASLRAVLIIFFIALLFMLHLVPLSIPGPATSYSVATISRSRQRRGHGRDALTSIASSPRRVEQRLRTSPTFGNCFSRSHGGYSPEPLVYDCSSALFSRFDVQRHQAGERNREVELSGHRFEDSERTRDGMNWRDVAVTHGREGDEAVIDPGLRYRSFAGRAGPRPRTQDVQKLIGACPGEAEQQIYGDRTLDALACDRPGAINSRCHDDSEQRQGGERGNLAPCREMR